jgi:hypothetical protein
MIGCRDSPLHFSKTSPLKSAFVPMVIMYALMLAIANAWRCTRLLLVLHESCAVLLHLHYKWPLMQPQPDGTFDAVQHLNSQLTLVSFTWQLSDPAQHSGA